MPTDAEREQIFNTAAEIIDAIQRAAYLDAACGHDQILRSQIEELLRHDEQAGSFLAGSSQPETGDYPPVTELPGTQIGPYRLMEQIGEGGFGLVFVAEQQEPVRRKVALKIIKPGMDTREVLARFSAERQALALMDHPNIAKVFDGGATETGRPYFVMELVRGVSVTDYCDQNQLTTRDRLELFVSVCQAVQHAHQKGIIHRDIKPSNVMVARHDDRAVVKIIDFGVAKAIGQQLTERTVYTHFAQMIGTPLYMSPEQAEMGALDIDTRSDIYSLGVLLYELLTGTTPFDKRRLQKAAFDEIRRVIREEEPEKPSTRLSHSGDSLPSVAAQRRTEPAKLSKLIRGDLDWITMKCLEKDRTRRYETANGIAIDVQRYLADEPVSAGPPSASYRLRKFVRRNQGTVAAAVAMTLLLIGGVVGTTWGMIRANAAQKAESRRADGEAKERVRAEIAEKTANVERDRANSEMRIATAVQNFLQKKLLSQADTEYQADTLLASGHDATRAQFNPTIRELLDRAAAECAGEKIEAQFPGQPEVQAAILNTIGEAYRSLSEFELAIEHLKRALKIQREHKSDRMQTVAIMANLGAAYSFSGRPKDAIAMLQQAHELVPHNSSATERVKFMTMRALADAHRFEEKWPEAIAQYKRIKEMCEKQLGPDAPETLRVVHDLATALRGSGQSAEAIPLLESVRDKRISSLGPLHPSTLVTINDLGVAYLQSRRVSEAISLLQRARDGLLEKMGPNNIATLAAQINLISAYGLNTENERALGLAEKLLPQVEQVLGLHHPNTRNLRTQMALSYTYLSRFGEAAEMRRMLVETERLRLPRQPLRLAEALDTWAAMLMFAERHAEAEAPLRECLEICEKEAPESLKTFRVKSILGGILVRQKKYAEAEPLLIEGYLGMKQREAAMGASSNSLLNAGLRRLVRLYDDWGKPEEAAKWKEKLPKSEKPTPKP